MKVVLRARAEADLREGYGWYQQQAGLGADFLAEIGRIVTLVAENPLMFQRVRGDIRRALVRRFPYALFYLVSRQQVSVLAVLHQAQRPPYGNR